MKSLAFDWLLMFAIVVGGLALLEWAPPTFTSVKQGAFVASLFAPVYWLRYEWAPRAYARRQKRKQQAQGNKP